MYQLQGRPQDLGGGPRIFFFEIWKFACRGMALLGGFEGMLPRENLYKWCNLVHFDIYLDQIFYFKKFQKVPFFI